MIGHTESNALAAAIGGLSPSRHRNEATRGTVTRVERSGTVWVRFVGADSDTPCARAVVSAKAGESVTVSVINGRATVTGNLTSPPTDDSTARSAADTGQRALQAANVAGAAARVAVIDAGRASIAARSAETSAKTAAESADSAASDAASAMSSALSALTQLGTVEDVMGTLAWLRDHEVYMPATEFSEGETYFELVDGKYVQVENPVVSDIANYYVYDHQATMAGFVQEHLTLTERGLYITLSKAERTVDGGIASDSGYILLSPNGGVETFAADGSLVSRHGDEVVMRSGDFTISLGDGRLAFIDDGVAVSWVSDKTMHIDRAEVASSMSIGNWAFEKRPDGNLSLMWREV